MPIVDFRFRPATEQFLSSIANPVHAGLMAAKGRTILPEPLSSYFATMAEVGIEKAVVPGRDIEATFGWRLPNEHIAEIVAAAPDRLLGVAGVDPNKGMAAVRELDRCVRKLGLRGVSLDPYMHRLPADHRFYYPIYAKCIELGVPVMITTGPAPRIPGTVMADSGPDAIDRVATDLPELMILVSHGSWPYVTQMIALAQRHPNLYFDFSAYEHMPGASLYAEAANSLIPDKIVFASAQPFTDVRTSLARFDKLPFTPESRQRVLYDNGVRLLKIWEEAYKQASAE